MSMKKLFVVAESLFILVGCLQLCGCATPQFQEARRFEDARYASVVLQFSSWDYIFVRRPAYQDEGGFLHAVKRDEIAGVVNGLSVPRELAVVTVGWQYDPATLRGLARDWESILGQCGFRRVVIVHPNFSGELDGTDIIDDKIVNGATQTAKL